MFVCTNTEYGDEDDRDHRRVYERLKARKREGESFTELVDRLMDEARPDWRTGFGTLPEDAATELRKSVEEGRTALGEGLTARQDRNLETVTDVDDHDEAP